MTVQKQLRHQRVEYGLVVVPCQAVNTRTLLSPPLPFISEPDIARSLTDAA